MFGNYSIRNSSVVFAAEFSLPVQIAFGITYGLIALTTLVGNLLVLCAVFKYERLQIPTNYFVSSLAFADVTVAVLVLPLSLVYDLTGGWPFGWVLCYFFRSCDVMCCTASILHLCCISLDRYWAITQPLTYDTKMSNLRVAIMITTVWVCSAGISFIPIYLGWFTNDPDSLYRDTGTCDLSVNKIYAVFSSMTSFYVPFIVMIFAYAAILRIAKIQVNAIKKSLPRNDSSGNPRQGGKDAKLESIASDKKALRTLGIIMGVFLVSWLPFFLMYLIFPFCDHCHVSPTIISIITWLGYANSCMNPVIYAFMNRDFRWAFKKTLMCSK